MIDTAKAIAHGAANPETDIWEFWKRRAVPTRSTPVGVILTIPAAGSETSDSAVLTNEQECEKRGLNTDLNRPAFAILDPKLAMTLPTRQLSCGVTDILMHTLDRYFTPADDNELTDELAEALLRVVIRNGPKVVENENDLHAMSEIMWCGSVSHNGLTGLGAPREFTTHQLGHALSEKFDAIHGETLSAMWGNWARYVGETKPARFARFCKKRLGRGRCGRGRGGDARHRGDGEFLPEPAYAGESRRAEGRRRAERGGPSGAGAAVQLSENEDHR